jgi:hypothetical protein
MKKILIAALAALTITAHAGYVTVVGTNFTSSGRRLAADMTVVSSNDIVSAPSGLTFKTTIQVPTPNGAYSMSLLPGGYLAGIGSIYWGFTVPNVTNTVNMTDLVTNNIYTNGQSFGAIWGTRVTTNDATTGLLYDKVVAGTNVLIYVSTDTNGNQQLVINASASDLSAALAATNTALQSQIAAATNAAVNTVSNQIGLTNNALQAQITAATNAAVNTVSNQIGLTNNALQLQITGASNTLAVKAATNAANNVIVSNNVSTIQSEVTNIQGTYLSMTNFPQTATVDFSTIYKQVTLTNDYSITLGTGPGVTTLEILANGANRNITIPSNWTRYDGYGSPIVLTNGHSLLISIKSQSGTTSAVCVQSY